MTLTASEQLSGGFVRDLAGRLVIVASGGGNLTAAEQISGGFVRDQDGRLMTIASAGGALTGTEQISGGFVRDPQGRLVISSGATVGYSGGFQRDVAGRLVTSSAAGALGAGEAFSGGYVRDANGLLSLAGGLPQLTLTSVASDDFNRANGNISGANNWVASVDGTMTIATNEAVGAAGVAKGDYRSGEVYASDQYSQCVVGSVAIPVGQYVGPTVRNTTNQDCYGAFYYQPGAGSYEIDIQRRVAGTWTKILSAFLPGVLAAGTVITLVAQGNVISVQAGGVGVGAVVDSTITGGTPGITSFGIGTLDTWVGGNAATGAVGAALATDNFNRANGGLSVGQANWGIMTGYPAVDIPIVSNQLNPTTGTHAADVRTDAFAADQWAQVQMGLTDPNAAGFVAALTRVNGALNSGYMGVAFGVTGAIAYRIYRLDTGSSVQLVSAWAGQAAGLLTDPPGTVYTLVSKGTRHSLRVNGAEVLAVTDATYASGQPGIMLFPVSTADNWSAGNV